MDGDSLHSPAKDSMDWDAIFKGMRTARPPATQSTEFDKGFRKSGVSLTGSVDSMSEEAISERASMWGEGVASIVLKNSSHESTPRCSNVSLAESAVLRGSKDFPKPPKSVEKALSSIQLAFIVCDAIDQQDGLASILYASAGFMHMTGYSLPEIVGKDCMFLRGAGTDLQEIGRVRTALKKGDVYVGRLISYKKDGTPFWNLCTLSPISDDHGKVIKYFGIQAELNDSLPATDDRERRRKSRRSTELQPSRPDRSDSISRSISRSISDITAVFNSQSSRYRLGDEDGLPVFAIPQQQLAVQDDSRKRTATSTSLGVNPASSIDSRLTVPARDGNDYPLTIGRTTTVDSQLGISRRESKGYSLTIQRKPPKRLGADLASIPPIPPNERSDVKVERRSSVEPEGRPDADEIRPSGSHPLLWYLAAERSAEIEELKAKKSLVDPRETGAPGESGGDGADKTDRRASAVMKLFRSLIQSDRKSCKEWPETATASRRSNVSADAEFHATRASDTSSRKIDGRDRTRHSSMRYFSSLRTPSLDLLRAADTPSRHSVSDLRTSVPRQGRTSYYEPASSGGLALDRSQFCVVHG